jgi:hypothetical protein
MTCEPANALVTDKKPSSTVTQTRENQLTILERLEDLESKMDHVELILAGLLPPSRRRSGSLVSWFRAQLQTHTIEPGSTNGNR